MTGLIELEPQEVADLLAAGKIALVDVREPAEYDAAHIEGSTLVPLSAFDPAALPDAGVPVVFHCAVGGRSAQIAQACLSAGLPHGRHLRGGIRAWAAAGLPIVR